ncbi:vWA domain-containing protein [Tichowtungia aerotolerans]|uniref:VWFA domain-containing protein n=1 Tax=Tichowtungia aerotolerans TaxID=2697043 RepID=A0A6P1MGP8_9BACT|nr:hypothetical protein [Tichowtungia aerotolerans]QHI70756.1 hypothetical protein GT409_15350 [Tichowtungia aerotolerans]
MWKLKRSKSSNPAGSLKKKTIAASTEAAAISIGIHALLIILAGSIVAIKYVQKRDASFSGENVSRPKLERRQLQMPVKVQNLQKKSRRPKVTTRMASVSQASFSLPDMMGMGDLGSAGFDRSGGADRSLSSMGSAGSLGFGVSGVNFFGAKSKGEKMVFILDANKLMVEDRKGGYFTYKFAKDRLIEMINGMSSATLFNVMVYSGNTTVMFRSKLVPATPENREAVKQWIAPLNSTPSVVARLNRLPGTYREPRKYEDSPLYHLFGWVRPIQAAMEQRADNIFVLCSGYGIPRPSKEFLLKKYDVDSEEEWLESRGWGADRVAGYERKRAEILARARQKLAEENRARQAGGQPPKIVQDWWYYIRNELKWDWQSMPHLYELAPNNIVEPDWVIEHFEAVCRFNYAPQKLPNPAIHIVKLIAEDGTPIEPPGNEGCAYRFVSLKKIPRAFKGRFELLKGAKTMEDILKNNDLSDD